MGADVLMRQWNEFLRRCIASARVVSAPSFSGMVNHLALTERWFGSDERRPR